METIEILIALNILLELVMFCILGKMFNDKLKK